MENLDVTEVCFDSVLGRYLITTAALESGVVVLKEAPLVRGPFLQTVPVCLGCNKILSEGSSVPCARCGWPMCSEICQKSQLHVPECQFTENRGRKIEITNFGIQHPSYQFVTILRCLHLKENRPDDWSKLMQLQTSPDTPTTISPEFMLNFFKLQHRFTPTEISNIIGIIQINAHELPLTTPPQLAIYHKTSFLEHNCRSNCTKTFTSDAHILIITSQQLPNNSHLSICYSDPLWGVNSRRYHLKETKNFLCCCARCQDTSDHATHLNFLKCVDKTCAGILAPTSFIENTEDDWSCSKCARSISHETAEIITTKIGQELAKMPKGVAKYCKEFLIKYSKILPELHYYMVDVKVALVQLFSAQNIRSLVDFDLGVFRELCEELMEFLERVAPSEMRLRGFLAYQNARILKEVGQRNNQESGDKYRKLLELSSDLLQFEPIELLEGKIYRQIRQELLELK